VTNDSAAIEASSLNERTNLQVAGLCYNEGRDRGGLESTTSESGFLQPVAIDQEDDQWEVEILVGKRKAGRRVEYKVKWMGFPESANSWQPKRDIHPSLVSDYEAKVSQS
jgi:Chromo (CHRromatin Organisation MOdifier) domain